MRNYIRGGIRCFQKTKYKIGIIQRWIGMVCVAQKQKDYFYSLYLHKLVFGKKVFVLK